MKRTYPIILKQIMLVFLTLACSSCIWEDPALCPPGPEPVSYEVRFSFDYPHKNGEFGIGFDPEEIKTIHIYVFDENQTYIDTFIDSQPRISDKNYYTTFHLKPGIYNFIVYGNLTDDYRIDPKVPEKNLTNRDDIFYYYNGRDNNNIIHNYPKHLFYASLDNAVIAKPVESYVLPFTRNTYVLNFTAEGLPVNTDGYQFSVTDTNWKYRFDNSFLPCAEINYVQNSLPGNSPNQFISTFTTLRLDRERKPLLKFYNKKSGELIYQEPLIPLILKIEEQGIEVDFTERYEFNIHLLFGKDPVTGSLTVDIYVNGWSVVEKEVIIELN